MERGEGGGASGLPYAVRLLTASGLHSTKGYYVIIKHFATKKKSYVANTG